MSNDHLLDLARYADRQKFSEKITSLCALHPENDVAWTDQYNQFVERDQRVYIAGLAEYLYNTKRDIVRLAPFNRFIAPSVFSLKDPDGQTLKQRTDLLRKWADKAQDNDIFSVVRKVSAHHPPNVDCVLFTSKQKALVVAACKPPKGLRSVIPGPFDPRYPGSERV